jgi:hypothetical protein
LRRALPPQLGSVERVEGMRKAVGTLDQDVGSVAVLRGDLGQVSKGQGVLGVVTLIWQIVEHVSIIFIVRRRVVRDRLGMVVRLFVMIVHLGLVCWWVVVWSWSHILRMWRRMVVRLRMIVRFVRLHVVRFGRSMVIRSWMRLHVMRLWRRMIIRLMWLHIEGLRRVVDQMRLHVVRLGRRVIVRLGLMVGHFWMQVPAMDSKDIFQRSSLRGGNVACWMVHFRWWVIIWFNWWMIIWRHRWMIIRFHRWVIIWFHWRMIV